MRIKPIKRITVILIVVILCTVAGVNQVYSENLFEAVGLTAARTLIRYTVTYPVDYSEALRMYHLETTAEIFEYRALKAGFDDIVAKSDGTDSIRIAVPDGYEIDAVLDAIETPSCFSIKDPEGKTVITGEHLMLVHPMSEWTRDPESGDNSEEEPKYSIQYGVRIELNDEGTELLRESTSSNIGKSLPVYVDNQLVLAPTVLSPIEEGMVFLSGFSEEEANGLSRLILTCHLPLETIREEVCFMPTLLERLFGKEPKDAGYERVTLKRYTDDTIQ